MQHVFLIRRGIFLSLSLFFFFFFSSHVCPVYGNFCFVVFLLAFFLLMFPAKNCYNIAFLARRVCARFRARFLFYFIHFFVFFFYHRGVRDSFIKINAPAQIEF